MKIVVVDYGSGNLRSAAKAFARAGRDAGLAPDVTITGDAAALATASHIVLPGQGAFDECKRGLAAVPGMIEALERAVIGERKPFFGICIGMQLMAERSVEHGVHEGFGWIPGEVRPLEPADAALKIPHMGWNELDFGPGMGADGHPVLAGLGPGTHVYFVHSYHMVCAEAADLLARTDYGGSVTAMVGRANMVGTQFHPEKSQSAGLRMIANFLKWSPKT
jgi:glutamine amidotransferase